MLSVRMARMRVTTVRFSEDLWSLLEREAALGGISVSQYIREAALARAVAAAAVRGEAPFELLAGGVRDIAAGSNDDEQVRAAHRALANLSRVLARSHSEEAQALRAQAEQARRRTEAARAARPDGPRTG
jgi:hypothetical protein